MSQQWGCPARPYIRRHPGCRVGVQGGECCRDREGAPLHGVHGDDGSLLVSHSVFSSLHVNE